MIEQVNEANSTWSQTQQCPAARRLAGYVTGYVSIENLGRGPRGMSKEFKS